MSGDTFGSHTVEGVRNELSAGSARVPIGLTRSQWAETDQDNFNGRTGYDVVAQATTNNSISTKSKEDYRKSNDDNCSNSSNSDSDDTSYESDDSGAYCLRTKAALTHCNTAFTERCNSLSKILEELNGSRSSEENDLWWASKDEYNMDAYEQLIGDWPVDHPLCLPDWKMETNPTLCFDNVWQYEDLVAVMETKIHRLLEETHYDTVHIFTDFYKRFKRTRRADLRSFFQHYDIPINRRHHMCVSLAMEIMNQLIEMFPVLQQYLYIVSCEEQVIAFNEYIEMCEESDMKTQKTNVEKEHVMVAMKISIGGRSGVIIIDPGYHIAKAVTVMQDQLYPHTGWFTQTKEANVQRDYCYQFCQLSGNFVEWKEREIRGDQSTYKSSAIYVAHAYLTAVDVTVRRNLVYNFRSLLSRDAKGRVFAGIYLPIVSNCNEAQFTIFYDGPNEQRVRVKFLFNVFKNNKIPENLQQHLEKLAPQLKMSKKELTDLLKCLAEAVMDQDFISQVLAINNDIGNMSGDN